MSMVSSFTSHMMHVNPRSVLRPEYFDYSSLSTSASRCKLQPTDKRFNTNTAPVYSLDNPCPPRKRPCRRPYGHPYMHSSPDVLPHCSASCLPNNVHPAARYSASTVPVRNHLSSPDSDVLSRIESSSPCSTVTSKYSPDSTTHGCNKSNVHACQAGTWRCPGFKSVVRSWSSGATTKVEGVKYVCSYRHPAFSGSSKSS
ncbi:hypothetical protein AHF37_02817 [Paragonimus kellicotti]|nr:hypothetical protein AHF37_02817 [Paragonimus kellicotti]